MKIPKQAYTTEFKELAFKRVKDGRRISAVIKLWMGSAHFLTKTMDRVSTEMGLHVLAYNMKRVIKILGTGTLIDVMKA